MPADGLQPTMNIKYRERHDGAHLSIIALRDKVKVGAIWLKIATAEELEGSYDAIADTDIIEEDGEVGFLNDLVVNKDCRRQGIGRELVARLRAFAAREGVLFLYVHAVNVEDVDPVPFYEECGFEKIGEDSGGDPYLKISSISS